MQYRKDSAKDEELSLQGRRHSRQYSHFREGNESGGGGGGSSTDDNITLKNGYGGEEDDTEDRLSSLFHKL